MFLRSARGDTIINFTYLDQCRTCDRNGGPAKESIDHKYVDFIEKELLPKINSLAKKYTDWWTFKPSSPLKAYLSDREIVMDEYFSLEELRYQVMSILRHAAQFPNNSDVIVLEDHELQMIFDSWYIFVPDVENHLLAHVIPAPADISNDLQNKHMTEEFYINSPVDLLYKDTYRKAGQCYESSEEDSGISDCSDDSASDGRVSPETSGELPTKRLPGRMPTRRPSVEGPAGRKQLKRKAKPKIPPADTGGRDAEPMSGL